MRNKNFENRQSTEVVDKELHRTFVRLGNNRRLLANQLLAMLPEIFERGIYKKHARTIEEYAGRFGGLSGSVVRKRLRLEKYVKDKPNLRGAIASEGVHKVALIASLATVENEAAWADKVKNMSKPAIQELSKEVRWKMEMGEVSVGDGVNCKNTLCATAPQKIRVNLEGDLFFMFLKLKKKYGDMLTNQEVMKKIFEENLGRNLRSEFRNADGERDANGFRTQEKLDKKVTERVGNGKPPSAKVIPRVCCGFAIPGDTFVGGHAGCSKGRMSVMDNLGKAKSRYSSVHVRRNLLQKTSGRCSYPECQRPAEVFHHTDRFANSHSHESLKTMCKIHHEFAHNGLIQDEKYDIEDWQLQLQTGGLDEIDQLYREYRKAWQQ